MKGGRADSGLERAVWLCEPKCLCNQPVSLMLVVPLKVGDNLVHLQQSPMAKGRPLV